MSENQTILEFDVDISTVDDPIPLPVGDYIGTITGAKVRMSATGSHYVEVAFRVDPEQYPADYDVDDEPDGVVLYWRRVPYSSAKKDISRLKKFCKKIDVPATGTSVDVEDWVGREAKITVGHQEFEGEPQAQITHVNPVE